MAGSKRLSIAGLYVSLYSVFHGRNTALESVESIRQTFLLAENDERECCKKPLLDKYGVLCYIYLQSDRNLFVSWKGIFELLLNRYAKEKQNA